MSCEEKVKYSKRDATTKLKHLISTGKWNHKDKTSGRIYFCKICEAWHITHIEPYLDEPKLSGIRYAWKWIKILKKQNKK
jgi:hypothetical protein